LALLSAGVLGLTCAQNLQLPALPYSYDALEPHIREKTMRVHHLGHFQAYTDKTNDALKALRADPVTHDLAKLGIDAVLRNLGNISAPLAAQLRNNGGGFVNHELFFSSLAAPHEGASERENAVGGLLDAQSEVAQRISRDFGEFDTFKAAFEDAASRLFGSGWVWLELHTPEAGTPILRITTTPNQDTPAMYPGRVPLLGLDLWEHAWYLELCDEHSKRPALERAAYIYGFWKVINWRVVDARLQAALQDQLVTAAIDAAGSSGFPGL